MNIPPRPHPLSGHPGIDAVRFQSENPKKTAGKPELQQKLPRSGFASAQGADQFSKTRKSTRPPHATNQSTPTVAQLRQVLKYGKIDPEREARELEILSNLRDASTSDMVRTMSQRYTQITGRKQRPEHVRELKERGKHTTTAIALLEGIRRDNPTDYCLLNNPNPARHQSQFPNFSSFRRFEDYQTAKKAHEAETQRIADEEYDQVEREERDPTNPERTIKLESAFYIPGQTPKTGKRPIERTGQRAPADRQNDLGFVVRRTAKTKWNNVMDVITESLESVHISRTGSETP